MIEVLTFVFQDFTHWLGFAILLWIVVIPFIARAMK